MHSTRPAYECTQGMTLDSVAVFEKRVHEIGLGDFLPTFKKLNWGKSGNSRHDWTTLLAMGARSASTMKS